MSAITQEQLDQAVAETRGVLEQLLYSQVDELVKAVGEPGAEDSAPPAAEGSAETPETSDAAPGEAPGEDPGGGEGAGEPPSMDQLVQEYAQLPPDQLKMHLMAAQAAYEQVAGGGAGGDAGAPPAASAGPPAGPGGPPPGSPPAGPDPMMAMKSEVAKLTALVKKSTAELETLRKSVAEAKKPKVTPRAVNGNNAAERLTPEQLRPTGRVLTKAEITKQLSRLTQDPTKLSKSDRDSINEYYNGGGKDLSLLVNIEGLKLK